jgi:hypothetical protein
MEQIYSHKAMSELMTSRVSTGCLFSVAKKSTFVGLRGKKVPSKAYTGALFCILLRCTKAMEACNSELGEIIVCLLFCFKFHSKALGNYITFNWIFKRVIKY